LKGQEKEMNSNFTRKYLPGSKHPHYILSITVRRTKFIDFHSEEKFLGSGVTQGITQMAGKQSWGKGEGKLVFPSGRSKLTTKFIIDTGL
jgi:hypothetical protein